MQLFFSSTKTMSMQPAACQFNCVVFPFLPSEFHKEPVWQQFKTITWRSWLNTVRDPLVMLLNLAQAFVSQQFFFLSFFGARCYQEKEISRGLIDRSTRTWDFDASDPSWVKHCRMQRCAVATPPPTFFFGFHCPLVGPTDDNALKHLDQQLVKFVK